MSAGYDLRRDVRVKLAASGLPTHAVDEIADLAVFATEQAIQRVSEIVARASTGQVSYVALQIALQLIASSATAVVSDIVSAADGAPVKTMQIGGGK